jgi:hypothetical protein
VCAFVKIGQPILAKPEFCPVVVARPGIEVDEEKCLLDGAKEFVEAKSLKDHDSLVVEIFPTTFSLDRSLDIETVEQFCACFVAKIIESPIGLRTEFPKANPILDRPQPFFMPTVHGVGIKRYEDPAGGTIYEDHEAPVASCPTMYRLAETQLIWDRLMGPTILRK